MRETNAKDYAREIIERIEHSFSPSAVLQLIGKRTVFVAAVGSRVVGTASLDGSVVRTVFVSPDLQARGIGKLLMAENLRDALWSLELLLRQENVDPKRLGCVGLSYGVTSGSQSPCKCCRGSVMFSSPSREAT